MCSLILRILFSLLTNYLSKRYKIAVIKTCFQTGFEFMKKNIIYREKVIKKEKPGTVTKVKLVTKN